MTTPIQSLAVEPQSTETQNFRSTRYKHWVNGFIVDGDYLLIKFNKRTWMKTTEYIWNEIAPPFPVPEDAKGIPTLVNPDDPFYIWVEKPVKYHPCWFVWSEQSLAITDMVTNRVIGRSPQPLATALTFSCPDDNGDAWANYRKQAADYYKSTGITVADLSMPTRDAIVRELALSKYEDCQAHGDSYRSFIDPKNDIRLTSAAVANIVRNREAYILAYHSGCETIAETGVATFCKAFTKDQVGHIFIGGKHFSQYPESMRWLFDFRAYFYGNLAKGQHIQTAFENAIASVPSAANIVGMYEGQYSTPQVFPNLVVMETDPPGAGYFNYNTGYYGSCYKTITAYPNRGYKLVGMSFWLRYGDFTHVYDSPSISLPLADDKCYFVYARFEEVVQRTLVMGVRGDGVVTPAVGAHTYDQGTIVTLSAVPSSGWNFFSWEGNLGGVPDIQKPTISVVMDSNRNITAVFMQAVSLTIQVSPSGSGTTSPPIGTSTREAGSTIHIEAFANPGYEFVSWEATWGSGVETHYYPTADLWMPQANVQLVANFRKIEAPPPTTCNLQILVHYDWQGYTSPSKGIYTKNYGDKVTIAAYPYSGYSFDYWGLSDGSTSKSLTLDFTITQNMVVTANFKSSTPGVWSLIMRASPSGAGTTHPPVGSYTYPDGEVIEIDAFPNPGYAFDRWQLPDGFTTTQKYNEVEMDRNYDLTAYFKTAPIIKYNLVTSVSPAGVGSVSPGPGSYNKGSVVTINAIPNYGYEFSHWSGDASGSNPTTSVVMDRDKNVVANFRAGKFTLSTTVTPVGSGSVSPAGGVYDKGAIASMTATPIVGYKFDYWSGDASGALPTMDVIMDRDKNITAHFKAATAETFKLTSSVVGMGRINPASGDFEQGATIQVAAIPDSGWGFSSWVETDNNSINPTYVTMNSDRHITANFIREEEGTPTAPDFLSMIVPLIMMSMVSDVAGGIGG